MKANWILVALVSLLSGATVVQVAAQQAKTEAEPDLVYFPIFSEEMINNASPVQAKRMRETEERSRKGFEERQKAVQERQAEAEAQRETQAEKEADDDRQDTPALPPANAPRSKSKVFKWVDANGRVHFGDAPPGKGAQEIKVGGAARIEGTPLPPPGQKKEQADPD